MIGMIKKVVKGGLTLAVLLAVVGVGAAMIAGPGRSRAVLREVQEHVHAAIDANVDDPTALRTQLENLEKQFPKRIAMVSGDLAALSDEIRQLEREKAICERVVALAERDLEVLGPRLEAAMSPTSPASPASPASSGTLSNVRLAAVAFQDKVMSYDRAASKLDQIRQTRVAYANRATDAEHDLLYLQKQESRLAETLLELEKERAAYQTQIQQLSRQVDAIARNERLIDMMKRWQPTIEKYSRYEASNLDRLTGRLSEIRSRQEAELDVLANQAGQPQYEEQARMELEAEARAAAEFGSLPMLEREL